MSSTPPPVDMPRDRLARPMFWLAFFFLLLVAGLIYRFNRPGVTESEKWFLQNGVFVLWPLFHLEMFWRFIHPHRVASRGKEFLRWILVAVFPPFRMGLKSVSRPNQIWMPFLGWRDVDKSIVRTLDRFFAVPMLVFAFLILPIFIIEYTAQNTIERNPGLGLALHIGISVIWVAFALEFILKIGVAPRALTYFKEKWLDAAIVILPAMEFVLTNWVDAAPLARLLRLSRAIQPEQLGRMSRLYRLRGLIMRAWHAVLLLEVVGRIMGNPPEKQLKRLEEQLAMKEEELAEILAEIEAVRKRIAERETTIPTPEPLIELPTAPESPPTEENTSREESTDEKPVGSTNQ